MKFAIGQHVCHPSYGPGEIVDIEEQTIQDSPTEYYVIHFLGQNLTTRTPVDAVDKIGLRAVISEKQTEKILSTLSQEPQPLPTDHKRRQAQLKALIFSGKPVKVAQAIRELSWRRFRRGSLNASDKKLLNQGKEMLVNEVALAQDAERMSVAAMIDNVLSAAREEMQEPNAA